MMSRITGFGRGWQEQKATGPASRFFQIMREPATTKSYVYVMVFLVVVELALVIGLAA